MTRVKKIIIGASTTSVLSGGGILSYLFLKATRNKKQIEQAFLDGSLEPLDPKKEGGDWVPVVEAYRLAKKDIFEDIKPAEINEKFWKKDAKKLLKKKQYWPLNDV